MTRLTRFTVALALTTVLASSVVLAGSRQGARQDEVLRQARVPVGRTSVG